MTLDDSATAAPLHDAQFRAEAVSVSRGGARIVSNISLALGPSDAAILRGPNGAGKTTLLRAFAGLLRADAGTIAVHRCGGGNLDDKEQALIYCGPLNATKAALSVDENLRFWAALYSAPPSAVERARTAFRLQPYAARAAGALSTGLGRRLGLSRLILANRAIWFVDEPTASLDAASAAIFADLIAEHRAAGGIAVIATHDALDFPGARNIELMADAS